MRLAPTVARPSLLFPQPSPLHSPCPRRSPVSFLIAPPKRSLPPRLHRSLAAFALIVIVVPHPRFLYRPHQLTNAPSSLTKPTFPKAPRLIGVLSSSTANPPSPFCLEPIFHKLQPKASTGTIAVMSHPSVSVAFRNHVALARLLRLRLGPPTTRFTTQFTFPNNRGSSASRDPREDHTQLGHGAHPRSQHTRPEANTHPYASCQYCSRMLSGCCAPAAWHSCSLDLSSIKPDSLHRGSFTDLIPISCTGDIPITTPSPSVKIL